MTLGPHERLVGRQVQGPTKRRRVPTREGLKRLRGAIG